MEDNLERFLRDKHLMEKDFGPDVSPILAFAIDAGRNGDIHGLREMLDMAARKPTAP